MTDRENAVTIWAEVIEDILQIVPVAIREEIVAAVVKKTEKWATDRKEHGPFRIISLAEMTKDFDKDPRNMHHHEINEAISLVIQVLVRNITSDNSPEDAAKILFREHRHGAGGRWLPEYLDGLPGITVKLKEATKIAEQNGKSELWFGD